MVRRLRADGAVLLGGRGWPPSVLSYSFVIHDALFYVEHDIFTYIMLSLWYLSIVNYVWRDCE